jgi:hypothetical protein
MHPEALKFREVMAQMMAAHSSPRTTKSSSPPVSWCRWCIASGLDLLSEFSLSAW